MIKSHDQENIQKKKYFIGVSETVSMTIMMESLASSRQAWGWRSS